ncbi:MAG: TIGR02679 family protein [Clostridiales bacterium GWE2_32_10]|nr:MAG: TIGR02679 family protein [Clostridiales bacterium GWE2_32_10]HBY21461.1 TIGR02679 family protein [Clostridiales bacterium]
MQKECIKYFKNTPAFKRLLEGLRKKYESLDGIGGNIHIRNLSMAERETFSGFFREDFYNKKNANIPVKKIQKALDNSRFKGVLLKDIIDDYFGEEVVSNKQRNENYNRDKEIFFEDILDGITDKALKSMLQEEKNGLSKMITQIYNLSQQKLKNAILTLDKSVCNLPYKNNTKETLPVFASNITKDPHAFDDGTINLKMLINYLCVLNQSGVPKNVEEKNELLYSVGLIKDDISSFTFSKGLIAVKKSTIHSGWQGFYDNNEILQISVLNLMEIDEIIVPQRKVYVVENPMIFREIVNSTENDVAIVCTYGQLRLASIFLLDMIIKGGNELVYSGDFDPEGIMIADKLKLRYKEALSLWRFGIDDYENAVSNIVITEARLKKLDKVASNELKEVARYIQATKRAGYQENIVDLLRGDVLRG